MADAGFAGLVLKVGIAGIVAFDRSQADVVFTAGAGVDWDALVARAVEANCAGWNVSAAFPAQ